MMQTELMKGLDQNFKDSDNAIASPCEAVIDTRCLIH